MKQINVIKLMLCIINTLMGHKYILRNAFSQIIKSSSEYPSVHEYIEPIGKGKSGYVGGLDMRQV